VRNDRIAIDVDGILEIENKNSIIGVRNEIIETSIG
jgi:hypothetical protein